MGKPVAPILGIVALNLLIGNLIIVAGGSASFTGTPGYYLAGGMSMACVLIYLLVYIFIGRLASLSYVKLYLLLLCCSMLIVLTGTLMTILLKGDLQDHFIAGIVMGIGSVLVYFPVLLIISGIGLLWMWFYRRKV